MSERSHGRHRAPGRYNPVTELTSIVSDAATPLANGSAVLAASGGLVAAIAVPASASPVDNPADGGTDVTVAAAVPAVAAPETTAPVAGQMGFGQLEVTAVEKPKGPTPEQIAARQRAAREQAARDEAAREQAAQEQAAQEQTAQEQAAQEQAAQERSAQPASRSSQRTSPAPAASAPAQAPAPAPASSSSNVIAIAKQYIGTPYVYGGSTPAGFDCSGFTQYVFAQAGKSLPRVTTAQQAAVTPVSNPQPGDLVFFGSPSWHVGIYVGDGMMIDSPRSGSSISIRPIFSGVSGYGRVG